jgi:hypothetical protein
MKITIMTNSLLQQHDDVHFKNLFFISPNYDQFTLQYPFLMLNEWQGDYV